MLTSSSSSPPLCATGHSIHAHRSRANTSSPRPRPKNTLPTSLQPRQASPASHRRVTIPSPPAPTKPQTVDTGTQYTPPDWPPTSTRSSLRAIPPADLVPAPTDTDAPAEIADSAQPDPTTSITTRKLAVIEPSEPPEPQLRVTPQIPLQNAHGSNRRSRSTVSDSPPSTPSSKRTRSQKPNARVMPADYAECESKQLASMIADMLMELIRFNDEIPLGNGHLTRFHSRAPPGISVHDYLARLTFHATLPPPILLSMVYYIDKLCALYPAFTINSLTVHRFLITAATVASKGLSDSFWTNSTYARVGGVSLKELALLELELLTRVQWRIIPSPEALVDYYRHLVGRSEDYKIAGDDEQDEDDEEEEDRSEQDGLGPTRGKRKERTGVDGVDGAASASRTDENATEPMDTSSSSSSSDAG